MTPVKIPALGESITSGTIASWHVSDGELVSEGQVIYELETDKITSEGTADAGGKISLKAQEGDEVEIGAVVAEIDESASAGSASSEKGNNEQTAEIDASSANETKPKSAEQTTEGTPSPASESKKDTQEQPTPAAGGDAKAHAPSVRRIAEETGVDPNQVSGTGKGGRVTKEDMLKTPPQETPPSEGKAAGPEPPSTSPTSSAAAQDTREPTPTPTPSTGSTSGGTREKPVTRKKLSPLRKRIAERLVSAQQTAAMLTTFNECNMHALMKTRKKHQERFVEKHGVKLGFMSFFIKATVQALKEVPGLNSQIDGDEIVQNHFYDIGVAVGTEKGLIVPVIRECDTKSFAQIEQDILDYAQKARDGKIQIEDLQGGCFTISNGGIYGSMLSTPIINMPQSGILGIHNITERPVAENGEVVIRPMMYLAHSYDHRVVDGKEAVTFLVKIKECIEAPERMLFEI